MKKYLSAFLFIFSIAFLIPGITQPLMTIKATVNKQKMFDMAAESLFSQGQGNNFIQNMLQSALHQINVDGTVNVFESTRSLLETMQELISHNHAIVGLLIGLFGVVIPVIKIFLTLISLLSNSEKTSNRLLNISSLLSKWSMSDVFVIAIMVAFFAVNANEQAINSVQMNAELGSGFYFFASYCLIAIVAGQLLQYQNRQKD